MSTEAECVERLGEVVPRGGAICLVGAGFSVAATDQQGVHVPNTQELIQEIKSKIDVDPAEDVSLADIADYCAEHLRYQEALRRILVGRLTLCNPSDSQRVIVRQPWRSIFTTNFDDTLERCLPADGYQTITPTSGSTNRVTGKLPIYYMHGRAKDLVESSKDPRFVISERNYLKLRDENRELYAQFKNELFCANLIVIIGYSMRDLEVARMLIEPGHAFRRKTLIICSTSEKQLSISRLNKFGDVLPIGVAGLAEELNGAPSLSATQRGSLQFVEDVRPIDAASVIDGEDFIRLILTGNFSHSKYQAQLGQDDGAPEIYCIRRSAALEAVVDRPADSSNRFMVSSDIGNGKSVFLDQLVNELVGAGFRVIRISSGLNEVFTELEGALQTHERTAFLLDDVIRYRSVAMFLGARLNSYCVLVCCTRADPDDIIFKELCSSLGGDVRQIDLNRLIPEELQKWDMALERWGFWEQRISLNFTERMDFLSRKCGAENRSIVLSLFRNSQIAAKIDQIVNFFLRSGNFRSAFGALLISSLCQQHVAWESIVSWLEIDEGRLRESIRKSDIADLFASGRDWHMFTSSQLAEYILRNKYVAADKDTLVEVFSTIVLNTAESAADTHLGAVFRENLKELMKFRFLTRLFGDDAVALKLINLVYKRLSSASLIRKNPQFWLQYAMSKMEVDDLASAESYLNTALGLAKERGVDYSAYQILDQRARLYFRVNSQVRGKLKEPEIKAAIRDLSNVLNDPNSEVIYVFRSVPLIRDFIEMQIDDCKEELRRNLLELLEKINAAGQGYTRLPRSQRGETVVLKKAMSDALMTLRSAG